MAARLWRLLFACGFVIAAAFGATLWCLFPVSAQVAVVAALIFALCTPTALVVMSFLIAMLSGPRKWGLSDMGYQLRALLTEVIHFNLAALAIMASRRSGTHPGAASPDIRDRPLILIHGIVCNQSVWNSWLERLRASGFGPIRVMDLEPPLADIESHAVRVERDLRALQQKSEGARVDIVAHSMGGLVARAALRRVGPDVIGNIVTIASPHHGTAFARWFRWPPLRQMCPDSPWLSALNAAQETVQGVPLTSIYSLEDNLIVPASSCVYRPGRVFEMRGVGHVGMLSSRRVMECALMALARGSST